MEVEIMKKPQRETTPKIETLGKKSGTIDVSISNRIQEMEERILGAEDSRENMHRLEPRTTLPAESCPTPTRAHTGLPTGS